MQLFRYGHVARAAIACGLCASVRGNHAEAIRWLDLVTHAEDVPPDVADQLLARRIGVLANAGRWAEIERAVRIARRQTPDETVPVGVARYLVVLALEADRRGNADLVEAHRRHRPVRAGRPR